MTILMIFMISTPEPLTMTLRYAHLAPGGGRAYLSALDAPARMAAE